VCCRGEFREKDKGVLEERFRRETVEK
jgi:hypothetical protein